MDSNWVEVDSLVDEFESACRSWLKTGGSRDQLPALESFLERGQPEVRPDLLGMLLPIELEYRTLAKHSPVPEEYERLGSSAVELVREVLKDQTTLNRQSQARGLGLPGGSQVGSRSRVIGNYKLLQKLGDGGMGTVWMAEQERPVRRRVAIKLIRFGLDTEQIIARFEAERQALAMMDHPNIARVFDGGTTADGAPYFVMELVQGIEFTEYCDRNQLSIRERLELFIPVCEAIQHAHQKGVMHRDLKPSNILVTLYDGRAMPKVIDFGLAKALQQHTRLSDRTMFTEFGQMVGTLQYMSPEQAEMNALDVDTRSDVYSLGAMLYEVLTGSTPLERESIAQYSLGRVLEMIREADPPRPSHRLSSTAEKKVEGLSQQRRLEPRRLKRALAGDLDWIVMKALEKDRSRRYDSARALAKDLRSFIEGDVVAARPPSTLYKLRKFARKNRTITSAFVGILLLSLAFGIGAVLLLQSENDARREAEEARLAEEDSRHQAEQRQRKLEVYAEQLEKEKKNALLKEQEAISERNVARAVQDFLQESFLQNASVWEQANQFGPGHKISSQVTVGELLDRAAREFSPERIKEKFPGSLQVQTEILDTIGEAMAVTGKHDEAVRFAAAALKLQQGTFRDDAHPIVLSYKTQLALTHVLAEDFASSFSLIADLVEGVRGKLLLEKEAIDQAQAAGKPAPVLDGPESGVACMTAIFEMFDRKTDPAKFVYPSFSGLDLFEAARFRYLSMVPHTLEVYGLLKSRLGEDDKRVAVLQGLVGMLYQVTGQTQRAIDEYGVVFRRFQRLFAPSDKKMIAARIVYAAALKQGSKPEQVALALELNLESLQLLKELLGSFHPATVGHAAVVADQLEAAGRFAEALELSRESYKSLKIQLPGEMGTLKTGRDTALLYKRMGDLTEAKRLLEEVLQEWEARGPESIEDASAVRIKLAETLLDLGDAEPGLELATRAEVERKRARQTNWYRKVVARGHIQLAQWDQAGSRLGLDVAAPEFLDAVLNEARILLRDPEQAGAIATARKLIDYCEGRLTENTEFALQRGKLLAIQGWPLTREKAWEQAEKTLLEAVDLLDLELASASPEAEAQRAVFRQLAIQLLVEISRHSGDAAKLEQWEARLARDRKKNLTD